MTYYTKRVLEAQTITALYAMKLAGVDTADLPQKFTVDEIESLTTQGMHMMKEILETEDVLEGMEA